MRRVQACADTLVDTSLQVGFKLLEDPTLAKDADARRSVFVLLGTVTQQFSQAFGATTSILHLLGHFEHLPTPLAELVVFMVEKYDGQPVVNELMHEIGRNDPKECVSDPPFAFLSSSSASSFCNS